MKVLVFVVVAVFAVFMVFKLLFKLLFKLFRLWRLLWVLEVLTVKDLGSVWGWKGGFLCKIETGRERFKVLANWWNLSPQKSRKWQKKEQNFPFLYFWLQSYFKNYFKNFKNLKSADRRSNKLPIFSIIRFSFN